MKASCNFRAICLLLCALVGAVIFARTSAAPCDPSPFDCAQDLPYPWLYQRDDLPLSPAENVVAVIAVGDVMLGRGLADLSNPFAAVRPWLRAADLTLGNLECVIAEDTESSPPGALYAPPVVTVQLRNAGFDLLSLANNHALDLGPQGLAETVARLEGAGIAPVGLDPAPLIRQVGHVRLAFLAFNAVPPFFETDVSPDRESLRWDPARAAEAVDMARAQADALIVSIHWGYEYETQVDPAQREAARILSEAGADLVLGHHPHVVQGTDLVSGHFVAYSLGNFVFDQQQGETGRGLALRAFFDERGLRAVQALPVWAGPRPELMELEDAQSLVARIIPSSGRVAFKCDERACRAVEYPQSQSQSALAESGLFWGGEIDLTGDGVPEQVRRAGERVIVYQDGVEAWRSPDTWRVVDLALGDPNDDGRSEMLLAFWRPDTEAPQAPGAKREGVHTSHPFIVGYRGGSYRTLWGGSAVSAPIREVALGDVDGDGAQDLVVLEEHDEGSKSSVAVWRWHGWGFSLMWRSQPGDYQDLTLIGDDAQKRSVISVSSCLKMP